MDFKAPQELWNPLNKAVPGVFHRSFGDSKCNCLHDHANFHRSQALPIVQIFDITYIRVWTHNRHPISCLDITIKLWGVCCEDLGEMSLSYNGTELMWLSGSATTAVRTGFKMHEAVLATVVGWGEKLCATAYKGCHLGGPLLGLQLWLNQPPVQLFQIYVQIIKFISLVVRLNVWLFRVKNLKRKKAILRKEITTLCQLFNEKSCSQFATSLELCNRLLVV